MKSQPEHNSKPSTSFRIQRTPIAMLSFVINGTVINIFLIYLLTDRMKKSEHIFYSSYFNTV